MNDKKQELKRKLSAIVSKANIPQKKETLSFLEKQTYEPSFWQDSKKAIEILKQITDLKKEINNVEMMQLLFEENNFNEAEKLINKYEILLFLSEPYDKGNAIFSIHAGQG